MKKIFFLALLFSFENQCYFFYNGTEFNIFIKQKKSANIKKDYLHLEPFG